MKKINIIISYIMLIVFMITSLTGCGEKKVTYNQALTHFKSYVQDLGQIAQNYGYMLNESHELDIEDHFEYKIQISENEEVCVDFDLLYTNHDRCTEVFSVEYSNALYGQNDINTALFVDLVNCVSGKQISKEFTDDFVNEPKSKYSSERYGNEGDIVIDKYEELNFWGDWIIFYEVYSDGEEILDFSGDTKCTD